MGGKSRANNNAMLQFEMQQAAEAKQKEAERKARLESGAQQINQMFADANFGDEFYNRYRDAELANAMDQLGSQYDKSVTKARTDLSRAGLGRSSYANRAKADLAAQKDFQETGFRTQADQDVAQLRSGIQGQQQAALNQLYATEDPGVAAESAAGAIRSSAAATPNLAPLGELFRPLVIGSISAGQNLLDNYFTNTGIGTAGTPRRNVLTNTGDTAA